MNIPIMASSQDKSTEIFRLIKVLHATDLQLDELLGGEVDSVMDETGRSIVLRRAQGHLRQSEYARQAAILAALPANIALLDARGVIVSVNAAWSQFDCTNGLNNPQNAVGVNYLDVCDRAQGRDSHEAGAVATGIRSVLRGEAGSFSVEYPCQLLAEQRWFLLHVAPLSEGMPNGAVVMHLDVTERRLATSALALLSQQTERRERMLSTMLASINDFAYIYDRNGCFLFANRPMLDLWGLTLDQVVGKNYYDLGYPAATAKWLQAQVQEVFQTRNSLSFETSSIRHPDTGHYYECVYSPVMTSDDSVDFVVGITRDITERKRITEALRASEFQLRQITDTIPTLMAYLDTEQRFRFHNKAYEELLGLNFEQINGLTLAEVLGQPGYEGVRDKAEEVLRGYVVRYERVQKTARGDIRNYAMHYLPRYGEGPDEGKVVGFFSQGTDITEIKRIDRMKTEFISTVSHELRTPLTSIRGSLGLIDGGVAGEVPKAVKNLVGIAKNNCERLIRLINDILDSEKIESGKIRLDLQPVDIKELLQQTMATMDGFAVQHGVKLLFRSPDESLKVHIDSDRMIQVLTNLLSNAVKFSPPQSAVEVNVLRVGQQVRVEVADHGPGIPEEFRGRIFQKFSQADSSDTRQKGGSGLGLNISKALIEKMGGKIGFSSEAGAGTTFFLELPEWQNPAPAPPLQPVRTQAVLSRPRILVCEGDADVASLESDKPRILHVEDDPDVQCIVAAIAQDFANFEFAATLNEARAWLRERRFDLVLLDLELGQDSGWDLFEDIDALDPPPSVIVFSASDVDPAEGRQAEAVLVKARTSNAELLNTIQRVLQIPGDLGPTRPQPLG